MPARKLIALALTLMLAFSIVPAASADEAEAVYIFFSPGAEYTISPGQVAVLSTSILSGEPGALRRFIKTIDTQEYYLDGDLLLSTQDSLGLWGSPFRLDNDPTICATGQDWLAEWGPYALDLEPGDYEVRQVYSTDRGITDACDYDGDGHPEGFSNPPFSSDRTVTIHVLGE